MPDAAFWTEIYNSGLGEFYYRNGLDVAGLAHFEGQGDSAEIQGEAAAGSAIVLAGGGKDRWWCGRCSKCLFASILLMAWLDEDALVTVFSVSPLADPENLPVVQQLLGVRDHKPWDCVGAPDEVATALWLACQRHREASLPVLEWLCKTLAPQRQDWCVASWPLDTGQGRRIAKRGRRPRWLPQAR